MLLITKLFQVYTNIVRMYFFETQSKSFSTIIQVPVQEFSSKFMQLTTFISYPGKIPSDKLK